MGLFDRLNKPPTRDQFAERFLTALKAAGDQREMTYEPDKFRLVDAENNRITNLHNFYNEHCNLPKGERKNHLRSIIGALLQAEFEIPKDLDDARPDLLPKVWSRLPFAMMELRERLTGEAAPDIPCVSLGEHLLLGIVYDLPNAMQSVGQESLKDWDITLYEALEIAKDNLAELPFAQGKMGDEQSETILYTTLTNDNYDAARLTMIDRMESLELNGTPVALIPNRDNLLLGGEDDAQALTIMGVIAKQVLDEEPRPLSPFPLRLDRDAWVDWEVPADHPAQALLAGMQADYLGTAYAEQQQLLTEVFEKELQDVFVCSYSGIARPVDDADDDAGDDAAEETITYCVWGEGVTMALPKTQQVALLNENRETVAWNTWDAVLDVVGELLEPMADIYPPRWLTRGFPNAGQLEKIGNHQPQ